jgi:hypothetical protein
MRNCVFLQLQETGCVLSALVSIGIGLVQITPSAMRKILASHTLRLMIGSERAAPSGATPQSRDSVCHRKTESLSAIHANLSLGGAPYLGSISRTEIDASSASALCRPGNGRSPLSPECLKRVDGCPTDASRQHIRSTRRAGTDTRCFVSSRLPQTL